MDERKEHENEIKIINLTNDVTNIRDQVKQFRESDVRDIKNSLQALTESLQSLRNDVNLANNKGIENAEKINGHELRIVKLENKSDQGDLMIAKLQPEEVVKMVEAHQKRFEALDSNRYLVAAAIGIGSSIISLILGFIALKNNLIPT